MATIYSNLIFVFMLVGAILLLGCVTSSAPSGVVEQNTSTQNNISSTVSTPSEVRIAISGYAFNPSTIQITKGTTVIWTNNDAMPHTITSDTGIFDSGTFTQGQSWNMTFDNIGEFPYHCTIHQSMKAKIIVTG